MNTAILKEEEEKAKIQKDLRCAPRFRFVVRVGAPGTRAPSPPSPPPRGGLSFVRSSTHAALRPRSILTDRLSKINEALARRVMARNEYDKTIQETEAAYMKILESSQTLLHVLKRETVNLTKKKQYSS